MTQQNNLVQMLTPVVKRLPSYGKVAYKLYKREGITTGQKLLLGAGVVYAASPIDLIPGFIPVLGQLDDILVALYSLRKVLLQLPEDEQLELLEGYNLSLEQLNEDINTGNFVAKKIALKGMAYTGKGIIFAGLTAGKLLGRGGKKIIGMLKKRE